MTQRGKLVTVGVLFAVTVIAAAISLLIAAHPDNADKTWMPLIPTGICLAFAVIAAMLIMSYLNRDVAERGLRWKY